MISVVIPSYNRSKTILRSVESVLNQTYTDIEVIIVDDGSTDDTEKVIKSISDLRVKYIKQENLGACVARNKGVELAKGDYIAFHDSDDVWHKDKLKKQFDIINNTNADVVICKMALIDRSGNVKKIYPSYLSEGYIKPVKNLFEIGTQTIIGKSSIFKKYKFDDDLPRFQEFEMLYRVSKEYSIYCLDEVLVDYYVGDDSISKNPNKMFLAGKIILDMHPEIIKTKPIMAERLACNLLTAAFVIRKKNYNQYKECINLVFIYSHSIRTLVKYIYLLLLYFIKFK